MSRNPYLLVHVQKLVGIQKHVAQIDPGGVGGFRALRLLGEKGGGGIQLALARLAEGVFQQDELHRTYSHATQAFGDVRVYVGFVPTYPGDETLMQSALFRMLRPSLPMVEKQLDEMMKG